MCDRAGGSDTDVLGMAASVQTGLLPPHTRHAAMGRCGAWCMT